MEFERAERELHNWGHCNHDGWLENNAGYALPPTSVQYQPTTGDVWDEAGEASEPLDFQASAITERLVVEMGTEGAVGFEHYRVLVFYYTRLMVAHLPFDGTPYTREQAIKRLAKQMHTSFPGAERMLRDAQHRYWEKRKADRAEYLERKRALTSVGG